jgi:hypothetical protein
MIRYKILWILPSLAEIVPVALTPEYGLFWFFMSMAWAYGLQPG